MVCTQAGILGLVTYEFALEAYFNYGQQKTRKMYSRDKNLYAMLEDLKDYVMGMLTRCQQ